MTEAEVKIFHRVGPPGQQLTSETPFFTCVISDENRVEAREEFLDPSVRPEDRQRLLQKVSSLPDILHRFRDLEAPVMLRESTLNWKAGAVWPGEAKQFSFGDLVVEINHAPVG